MVTDEVIKLLEHELRLCKMTCPKKIAGNKESGNYITYKGIKFMNLEGVLGIYYMKWKRNYEYEIIRQSLENIENFSYLTVKSKV